MAETPENNLEQGTESTSGSGTYNKTPTSKFPEPTDDDEVGPCCVFCSTFQRKIGFFITLGVGALMYVLSIFNLIAGEISGVFFCLAGTAILVFSPLWMRSFPQIFDEMKEPIRYTTVIVLVGSVGGLIIFSLVFDNGLISFIFGTIVILTSLWYCLSYYEEGAGQQTVLNYIKSCCGGKKEKSSDAEGAA